MTTIYYPSFEMSYCWMQAGLISEKTNVKFIRRLSTVKPAMSLAKALLAKFISDTLRPILHYADILCYENQVVAGITPDIRWEQRGAVFIPIDECVGMEMPWLALKNPPANTYSPDDEDSEI